MSSLGNQFKMAVRDIREGVNALTTRHAPYKGWSGLGHFSMLTAVLQSMEYAARETTQNPEILKSLFWMTVGAGLFYYVSGRNARESRKQAEDALLEYHDRNKDTPVLKP